MDSSSSAHRLTLPQRINFSTPSQPSCLIPPLSIIPATHVPLLPSPESTPQSRAKSRVVSPILRFNFQLARTYIATSEPTALLHLLNRLTAADNAVREGAERELREGCGKAGDEVVRGLMWIGRAGNGASVSIVNGFG